MWRTSSLSRLLRNLWIRRGGAGGFACVAGSWRLLPPAAGAVMFLVCCAAAAQTQGPEQPVPFSHKQHAGTLKLECKTCHPNPDPGDAMTIAVPATCMQCHSTVKTGSPAIQKLAAAAKANQTLDWVRVYQIPSFVDFSHRIHLAKGNTCEECHGKVAERDRLYRETNLSMAGCLECHRTKKATLDCSGCHDPR